MAYGRPVIGPLSHADLAPPLAHLDDDPAHDRGAAPAPGPPMVAVRVRTSVGRRGASAKADHAP
jgi:hypothetical protein